MKLKFIVLLLMLTFVSSLFAQPSDSASSAVVSGTETVQAFAREFFEWRRSQQPVSGDDIPRVERPNGWVPDWSPEALEQYRERYRVYSRYLDGLDSSGWTIEEKVDLRLVQAALERVHWELDILRSPHRNPLFYVDQTLGSLFELLIIASPMNETRAENLLLRMEHIPDTLQHARKNLTHPIRPFAEVTIQTLSDIESRLERVRDALKPQFPESMHKRLNRSTRKAVSALKSYAKVLDSNLDEMQTAFAVGPDAYQWFLTHVALIPGTPDLLLAQGRMAWSRSIAWDVVEQNRNREAPEPTLFKNIEQQIQVAALKEEEIRRFLEAQDLMTVPDWLQHYYSAKMPEAVDALSFMGVADDLTSELRLDENAYRYVPEPSEDLAYFYLSAARDPRPLIIHEGVPGHYYQMALSWAHENPIRRRFIDSSANEGIGFYVEELLLQAGLFDFSPRSREIIYSYMRLRALRVEIDIRLATGDFSIQQAADYLARAVPMDRATAEHEAVFFAFNPGQAISYQIGKIQILRFLADAKLDKGEEFSLRHFHDFLMKNGNVPIALQRWEYLGRRDALNRLDGLGGKDATVPR